MSIYESLTSSPQSLEEKKYKVYILDNEEIDVEPGKEEDFLKQNPTAKLKSQSIVADPPKTTEPGKSQGTGQSQNNQQQNTVSSSGNGSSESHTLPKDYDPYATTEEHGIYQHYANVVDPRKHDSVGDAIDEQTEKLSKQYSYILGKYKDENQTEAEFFYSLNPTKEITTYTLGEEDYEFKREVSIIGGVHNNAQLKDDPRYDPIKYKELEFLHNQMKLSEDIKSGSLGDWYEGYNAAEVIHVHSANQHIITDPEEDGVIHTGEPNAIEREQLEEVENPTVTENKDYTEAIEEEAWNNFEQDFANNNSVFIDNYNKGKEEVIEKYAPGAVDQVIKEFEGEQKELDKSFEPIMNSIKQKFEEEFNKQFPEGGSQTDIDSFNDAFTKELEKAQIEHYGSLYDKIDKRYVEFISEIPEVQNYDSNNRKAYEEFMMNEWDSYFGKNSGLYNKWSLDEFEEMGNQYDAHGFQKMDYKEKMFYLKRDLLRRLETMERLDPSAFNLPGEKEEYINDFWAHWYRELQTKEVDVTKQIKGEDGIIREQTVKERQATQFFFKGMAEEMIEWDKGYDFNLEHSRIDNEKLKKAIDKFDSVNQYYGYSITAGNEQSQVLLDQIYETVRKNNPGMPEDEIEDSVARYYLENIRPNRARLREKAEDILDNPESLEDMGNSEFWNGFLSNKGYTYVPVISSLASIDDTFSLKRIVDKQEDGLELNEVEKRVLATASLLQQSDQATGELSWWYNAGKTGAHSISFMGEFALTFGWGSAAKTAVQKSITTAVKNQMLKSATKKGGSLFAARTSLNSTKMALNTKAITGLSYLTSIGARTAHPAFAPRWIDGTINRMTDEYAWSFSKDGESAGTTIDVQTPSTKMGEEMGLEKGDAFGKAFVKAFGSTYTEVFTETIGAGLGFIPRRMLNPIKIKGNPLGNAIFDSKVWKSISLGHFTRRMGFKTSAEVLDWTAKRAGWNGILQEIGEELINYPLQNLVEGTGPVWEGIRKYDPVYDTNGNVIDRKDMGWDWESMGTMAISVSAMGGAFAGFGGVANIAKGFKPKTYYVGGIKFDTFKNADAYLDKLIKDGKLNANTDIEVRNDFDAFDKWADKLEKNGLKADQIKVPKIKNNLKITAGEAEILSHKDLTVDQQNELRSINGELKNLNQNPVKNKKQIDKLKARKKKITDPIVKKIIQSKTRKQYRDTIKKIRKIIKDNKLSGKISIKTVRNAKKGEEYVLDMLGFKRNNNGKIVDKKTGKPRKVRDKEGNEVDIESALNKMKTAHGYFIPKDLLPEGSKDLMVLNDYLAITKKGENVAAHEFLHFYLSHILEESPEMRIAMGAVFQDYLGSIDPAMIRDGAFRKRLNAYNAADAATRAEEGMALFLDAIANGSMEYNESMFTKIGNVIRHILQALGVDIKFGDGKDVYNFLKDFNASVQRGELSPALKRALFKKINSTQPGQGTVDATGTIKSIMESEQMKKYVKEDAARTKQIQYMMDLKKAFSRMGIKFSMTEEVELTESTAAIVARNEELQNQLLELAEKEGMSPKKFLETNRGDRIKGEILFNNINIAYDLAKKKFIAGVNALKNAGVPNYESKAIPLQDFQQEFVYELTALVNTWDPSITLFPKYVNSKVQTGKSLIESRYQQILQRLKGNNIEAYSLSALQEKGFDYQDQGFGKSTESKKIKGTEVSDKLKIEEDALVALIQSADLSKLEKEKSYKRVKALVKNGSLTPVLQMVGDLFGIPVNKLSKNSDLSDKADDKNYPSQRSKARKFISELAKSNELFNFLPFAQDVDGRSTEIVRTMFGKFYEGSGQRVEVGEGALKKLGQKERFDRKEDVTNEDFFELFGMDKDGKAIKKGTEFDGAIREFVIQLASLMANQSIRKNKEGFTEIGRGRNPLMFSYPLVEVDNAIDQFSNDEIGSIKKFLKINGLPSMNIKIESKKDIEVYVNNLKKTILPILPKEAWFGPDKIGKDGKIIPYAHRKVNPNSKTGKNYEIGTAFTNSHRPFGLKSNDKLYLDLKNAIIDLKYDKNVKFGKPIPGVKSSEIWSLRSQLGSLFKDPQTIKNNEKNILKYNKNVAAIHKALWKRIKKSIKKDKFNAVHIASYLSLVSNDRAHWHKLGAQFIGSSKKITGDRYELEHAMPATRAYLYLLNSAMYNEINFDSAYDFIIQNYKLIALDKAMDKKLTSARTASGKSLQKTMPDGWSAIDGKWWQRYFNEIVEAIDGGIDPASIETLDGITLADMFNINSSGGIKASMPASKIKSMQNIDTAFSNVIKFSKTGKTQGMSVFDFDDTLGFTKSGIRATVPNQDGLPKPKRKVIFLAGGAGSGKGNVVSKLGLANMGFKIVNQDISLEWLKKNNGLPENMNELTKEQRSILGKLGHQARGIARRKMMKYQGNANGVVIDGTGGSVRSMQKLVDEFKSKGYDVSMLFVDTSLDVALERNRARKERSLLDKIVERNHESVQNNKSDFKSMFGNRFMEVNTDKLTQQDPMPDKLVKQMDDFVSSYEKLRLDAAEFAEQGDAILEQGGAFDFSEFNEVVDGSPGPLLNKAKQRASKYGNKNMFVLTARPQQSAKAIHEFLKSQGLNIPLKNITGLANSTGQAKADWIIEKVSEGYNDIYFVDDAYQNVESVQNALSQLDVKSDVVQAKIKFSKTGSQEFNEMIERAKGIKWDKVISQAEAKKRGKGVGKWDLYIPPSAEDFKGLLYYFLGKGKQGEADMKFFSDHLLKPFAKGIRAWNTHKQSMANDYKALKKEFKGKVKLTKKLPNSVFTVDSAIRVYLWAKNGFEIPGISTELQAELVGYVENNPDVKRFADTLSIITKRKDGYVSPTQNWSVETIPTDLRNIVDKIGRKEFLEEWIANKDIIFSPDNMNKIQALYGDGFVEALRDILFRMENGGNRKRGGSRIVNDFTDWINGSVGAIMFFNTRSAILQTISTVNFINWSDNNIFKASAAFANQPQFWKDFAMLFNSDQLKQRRGGLQTDVSASELTKSFAENGYTPTTLISYLLQKGFLPTQLADSFAIAFGGASMYRNRLKTNLKKGMSQKEAHDKAMLDFQEIAEETQQSSREDLVSMQQAGPLGRIILAFQNVTMQYGRLTKKALSDLVNRRGDTKTNISKIIYYGVAQNIVFAALQNALAFIMWGDDEEEIKDKTQSVANSALDSFLRGTGIYGALVSTLKNVGIQWHLQSQRGYDEDLMKIAQQAVNLSPPIGSKLRKLIQAYRGFNWNKGTSKELGWRIENPKLQGTANLIEALFNIPLARLVNKANNLEEAITGQHETWQRVALALGWSRWTLGVEDEELEEAKDAAKVKQKEIKKEEKIEEKKQEEKEMKDEGFKKVQCSGRNSRGKRCGMVSDWTKDKSWKCMHHMEFKDGMDRDGDGIKEYRCTAKTSSGKRCRNKTENKNKRCYAHQ